MSFRSPSRWPSFAALAIAIIGLGVGITGWFRPLPHEIHEQAPTAPAYSDQQIANAKTDVCVAYNYAKNEVALNTHRPDFEGDPVGSLAAATMKRLSLYAAGDYLLTRLTAQPATPAELADAVRSLANSYEQAAMRILNDEPSAALDPLRHAVDSDISKIDELCK
ncbi:hypothetical protein BMW24_008960 [Mycobacterium heckeshornense]|nr:hypothetical protein [Mycobacterium heckeshornense]MCV7035943.1 hypothetical protein [Mycobacterium heckeshornense]PIJ35232.1 hypothetical protein BMW24_008960 [Mycobacterium heckeshornense]